MVEEADGGVSQSQHTKPEADVSGSKGLAKMRRCKCLEVLCLQDLAEGGSTKVSRILLKNFMPMEMRSIAFSGASCRHLELFTWTSGCWSAINRKASLLSKTRFMIKEKQLEQHDIITQ